MLTVFGLHNSRTKPLKSGPSISHVRNNVGWSQPLGGHQIIRGTKPCVSKLAISSAITQQGMQVAHDLEETRVFNLFVWALELLWNRVWLVQKLLHAHGRRGPALNPSPRSPDYLQGADGTCGRMTKKTSKLVDIRADSEPPISCYTDRPKPTADHHPGGGLSGGWIGRQSTTSANKPRQVDDARFLQDLLLHQGISWPWNYPHFFHDEHLHVLG